jgi:hypothetical protein
MIVINVTYRIEGCMFLKYLLGYQLRCRSPSTFCPCTVYSEHLSDNYVLICSFYLISAMELALALEKLVNEKLHNLHAVSFFHMLIYRERLFG